jgi:hypothetical protein
MCYPNNADARALLIGMLRSWQSGSGDQPSLRRKLGRIQHDWLRTADAFHLLSDLIGGKHQARRGGPSIGKAITLAKSVAKSRGTGGATLWKMWSTYKDAAHLVTAATLVSAQARIMADHKPFGPFGLNSDQIGQFTMTMLMPDLVSAVALSFERLGLSFVPHGLEEPTLDPESLWRIPPDINVVPIPPPVRKIRLEDRVVLNKRQAGNRGKGRRSPDAT